jgi:hypothetical protein
MRLPGDFKVIERITRVTPLGVRFWDPAAGEPVGAGLLVTAYPVARPVQRLPLVSNSRGVYMLRNVPGLRAFEFGAGDAAFWANLPAPIPYMIEVRDPQMRYISFVFPANVPTQGLMALDCLPATSPPDLPPNVVPVYSTPARRFLGTTALIRALLYHPQRRLPAAWAVVEASHQGHLLARGIAAADGQVVLAFDYPEPLESAAPLASPGDNMEGIPLHEQGWEITLTARYAPPPPDTPPPALPNLCDVFNAPPARLWATWNDPPGAHVPFVFTLRYGQPHTATSVNASGDTGLPTAVVFVTP